MKTPLLFILLLYSSFYAHAQAGMSCSSECQGSLGENIFPDGDFGTGIANIFPTNPNIAPGYGYQTSPPPNDGFYVITNNTTPWGSFAVGNWIDIMDNGPEPNGYMMVVNAAFSPGLFYSKKVDVCANTLYEMSVDVISLINPSLAAQNINSNVAFLIDGNIVCETGVIPHDAVWHTYRFSFVTDPGTTSVTLAFQNNAPGGLGNDLAIDNISFRACGPDLIIKDTSYYCLDQSLLLHSEFVNSPYSTPNYQWQYNQNGTWTDIVGATALDWTVDNPQSGIRYRLLAANSLGNLGLTNCRSVSEVSASAFEDLSDFSISGSDKIICNGLPGELNAGIFAEYQWSTGEQGSIIEAGSPGWYAVTITTENGCKASDSISVVQIDLSIGKKSTDPGCFGENTGTVSAINPQGGQGPLTYTLDGGAPGSNPNFEGLAAGDHLLVVKDSLGCTVNLPFTLQEPPQLTLEIQPVPQLLAFDSVRLESYSNNYIVDYQWQPAEILNCPNCPNPIAKPLTNTWIVLNVTDDEGCTASESLLLSVEPRLDVYAPNVFSPEIGGQNAFFSVFLGKSAVMVKEFAIYDRWGGIIFQRENLPPNDENLMWDGISTSGKKALSGVYAWFAKIEFSDAVVRVYKGDVTLVR